MASQQQLADAQRLRQARRAESVAERARERWALVDPVNIAGSWAAQIAGMTGVIAAGQALTALQAEDYLRTVADDGPSLQLTGFAGVAADGRSLASLLALPPITALQQIGAGTAVPDAMQAGLAQLVLLSATEVADAGRVATGVGIAARPQVRGWVRVVNLPACDRCLVLAGRVYRWNAGFDRHPGCNCGQAPTGSAEADTQRSPEELFAAMTSAQQVAAMGSEAAAQAVRDGADLGRVVNARRLGSLYVAGGRGFTTEATTRRGGARSPRPTPAQIYREAGEDRAEAVRLLRRFGYLAS